MSTTRRLFRLLKSNEIVRKTDQVHCKINGKYRWRKVGGHGFKVKDCMCEHQYRRKVSVRTPFSTV